MRQQSWLPLALALALAGCAADKAGREFRHRLPSLVGHPVQVLIEELGPDANWRAPSRSYGWGQMTIGRGAGSCDIKVATDDKDRIVTATMEGSDYYCGSMIRDLRKREARYRRNPGLREREAAELERMMQELIGLRREINERNAEPALPPVEQPDQEQERGADADAHQKAEAGLALEYADDGAGHHGEGEQRSAGHAAAAAPRAGVGSFHRSRYGSRAAGGPARTRQYPQQAVQHPRARC